MVGGEFQRRFEVKTTVIGNGEGEAKEGRVLNRVIRITEKGWEYEGDQRHGEIIVKSQNLDEAKEVGTPGEEARPWKAEEEEEKLPEKTAKEYRALAARANYIAVDRMDIQFAVKEICRGMATPNLGDK